MDDRTTTGIDPSATDEAALLAALRAGDGRAFETLVRLHLDRLLAVTRRILGNEDDARDAVQDAFLSAFRGLDGFGGDSKLATWLHRIAVNAALMKLRRRRRKPEQSIEPLLPTFLEDGHPAHPAAPWQTGAAEVVERKELRQLVRDSIDRLPESYRTVLLLRDIEGLDTDETARLLEVTVGVVKTRLHRARQALRTLLDPHFRGVVV
jgi:RNA polymerase sigma-70 factor (ECF subfamily)